MSALDLPVTRRGVLLGVVAVAAACRSGHRAAAPDRDEAAMSMARDTELRIIEATSTTDPAYAVHVAHLKALGASLPASPPTASPPTATPAATPTTPSAAGVEASVPTLQAAANAVRDGGKAAVLASIAASHAALGRPLP